MYGEVQRSNCEGNFPISTSVKVVKICRASTTTLHEAFCMQLQKLSGWRRNIFWFNDFLIFPLNWYLSPDFMHFRHLCCSVHKCHWICVRRCLSEAFSVICTYIIFYPSRMQRRGFPGNCRWTLSCCNDGAPGRRGRYEHNYERAI